LWPLVSVPANILVPRSDDDSSLEIETSYRIKLFTKGVLVVTDNVDRYCDCYTNGVIANKKIEYFKGTKLISRTFDN
jgi:hypothetical protein